MPQVCRILGRLDTAAAGRDNAVRFGQSRDNLALKFSEMSLAVISEDLLNRHSALLYNPGIRVDKRLSEPFCKDTAYRGLAASAKTD